MNVVDHIVGHTYHGRKGSTENAFRYSIDYVMLDAEAEPETPWLFSRNAGNVASLQDNDHGGAPGEGRGAAWARDVLSAHQVRAPGRLMLLAQPRFLGHVFNPVSFWLAHDEHENLVAVIAEVSNTFGDRHSYLCRKPDNSPIEATDRLQATKIFYVSPFQPVEGGYEFRFDIRPDKIGIWIDYTQASGGLIATLTGPRRKISNGSILRVRSAAAAWVAPGTCPDPLAGAQAVVERLSVPHTDRAAVGRSQQLMGADRQNLGGYAIFAAVLASAGLPIYIHAPKFYVDEYGVSLAALGSVLFGLRLLDVVQDPLLGKLAVALRHVQGMAVGVTLAIMASAMVGLFAVTPPTNPLLWFAVMLTLVFSAFSFLTINFYARGVQKATELGGDTGYLRVARWRETGGLLGVCVASVLPSVFLAIAWPEFVAYAGVFALACLLAGIAMHNEWRGAATEPSAGFGIVLKDQISRRLLLIALVNAAPVAVSSTLFLFFVESRLDAPGWEGPLLLLFFIAAAAAAPFWGALAERIGAKPALLAAMVLAIIAFSFAMMLGSGDTLWFAIICLASGAAVGADLTLLPAVFARRMETVAPNASEGFALWSFVSKFTLAFAAIALLPILEVSGSRLVATTVARL